MFKNKKILILVTIALFASVPIWSLAVYISNLLEPNEKLGHFAFGAVTASFVVLLLLLLRQFDTKQANHNQRKRPSLQKGGKAFVTGALWFAIPATVALLLAVTLGYVDISLERSLPEAIGLISLAILFVFLGEALPEELIFRGYIFQKISLLTSQWITIFIQALLFTVFALLIGAVGGLLDASFLFTFGLVLGILRSATGYVAAAIGFHLACMTFQQLLGSQWGVFTISNETMVQTFIFGMIPISLTIAFLLQKVSQKTSTAHPRP